MHKTAHHTVCYTPQSVAQHAMKGTTHMPPPAHIIPAMPSTCHPHPRHPHPIPSHPCQAHYITESVSQPIWQTDGSPSGRQAKAIWQKQNQKATIRAPSEHPTRAPHQSTHQSTPSEHHQSLISLHILLHTVHAAAASHPHRIASHRVASHRFASHRIASRRDIYHYAAPPLVVSSNRRTRLCVP
jgi:hypothetical protein